MHNKHKYFFSPFLARNGALEINAAIAIATAAAVAARAGRGRPDLRAIKQKEKQRKQTNEWPISPRFILPIGERQAVRQTDRQTDRRPEGSKNREESRQTGKVRRGSESAPFREAQSDAAESLTRNQNGAAAITTRAENRRAPKWRPTC